MLAVATVAIRGQRWGSTGGWTEKKNKKKTAESSSTSVSLSEEGEEVWANASLQSLVLSVPHYVPKASEDLNP